MAKKQGINQSAEIRAIAEELGKTGKFKEAFAKLQARHKGQKFNENSCQQAFAMARRKLGFISGSHKRRVAVRRAASHGAAPNGHPGRAAAASGAQGILDVIRAAKQLIGMTGSTTAAKAVIDTL